VPKISPQQPETLVKANSNPKIERIEAILAEVTRLRAVPFHEIWPLSVGTLGLRRLEKVIYIRCAKGTAQVE